MSNLVPNRDNFLFPFEQAFDKLFDGMFGTNILSDMKGKGGYPKLDVISENGKWIVEAALPGMNIEDIIVEIVSDPEGLMHLMPKFMTIDCNGMQQSQKPIKLLKLSGRMSEEHHRSGAKYHVKELRRSSFERLVRLPDEVRGEPEATMKNGILSLTWDAPELTGPQRKTIVIKQG